MTKPLKLKFTGVAHGGEALGRMDDRVIFVGHALPGETALVEIVEQHKRWARGRLLEVLEPSPYRVEPSCVYFGPNGCGGCQWQHIHRQAQLDYKARIVRDQLRRVGGISKPVVRETITGPADWAYRTQALFYPSGQGSLGLPKSHTRDIVAIDHCPLLHPDLDDLYKSFNVEWDGLRSVDLSMGLSSGLRLVTMRTHGDQVPEIEVDIPVSIALETRSGAIQPLIGDPWYFETIRGHDYRFSAGARRPSSPQAAEAVLNAVISYLEPGPGRVMADVYCGQGLYALGLADQLSLIIGIEENAIAIEDCAFNCSHLDNVALHEGPPPVVLRALRDPIDLAVITPPAQGMGHRVAQNLARLGARRVVYVAHNPATLARDLAEMKRAGFRLRETAAVDVAPQTYYVTAVALFTR
ncbi:MAG: class I SAM-dependent RNA methyltransferase [Chloroflexi bacterium]|nr:class I SAM-dependent RNA methyltransferase [Chloroflexota bacterium]